MIDPAVVDPGGVGCGRRLLPMADVPCTRNWEQAPGVNPLMVPPCTCPRCTADPVEVIASRDDNFLRMSGSTRRPRVAPVELGPTGHLLLG